MQKKIFGQKDGDISMTVQELLRSVDTDEFLNEYLKNDGETIDILLSDEYTPIEKFAMIDRFKEMITKSLNQMREMEVVPDKEYIVFSLSYEEDGQFGWDCFMSKREDILKCNDIDRVEKYAFEFSPLEEVLCCDVSEVSRYTYYDVPVAVAIFKEMTFFGVDIEKRNEKTEKEIAIITEAAEECKSGNCESYVSADEMFARFGWTDNRTKKEKSFERKKAKMFGKLNMSISKLYMQWEKHYIETNTESTRF